MPMRIEPVPAPATAWYDDLLASLRETYPTEEVLRHFRLSKSRIVYTVGLLTRLGLEGKRICEVGPGGVGLACSRVLAAEVETYDCGDWFRRVCESFSIPWSPLDLNRSAFLPRGPYDAILLCEVIEHLARWPAQVLDELRSSLTPGGLLLASTPNLHRLSNRIRMLMGKRLFAHFLPEDLLMAHVREYTPEELERLFLSGGFRRVCWDLVTIPESSSGLVRGAYSLAGRLRPRLSNFIFCWGFKEGGGVDGGGALRAALDSQGGDR